MLVAFRGDLALAPRTREISGRGFHHTPMATGDLPSRRTERRRATRFAFRAELDIEWGSAVLRGSTRDLSASGMFIEAADTLWVGAGFTARLKLDKPVLLDCFVKRVEPGCGMGVSVDLSKAETQQRYQELLAQLSTPRP